MSDLPPAPDAPLGPAPGAMVMNGMIVPDHDPGEDDCPTFTRYVPWGSDVMYVVECDRPVGHENDDGAARRHHGVYTPEGGEPIEFWWDPPQDAPPITH